MPSNMASGAGIAAVAVEFVEFCGLEDDADATEGTGDSERSFREDWGDSEGGGIDGSLLEGLNPSATVNSSKS